MCQLPNGFRWFQCSLLWKERSALRLPRINIATILGMAAGRGSTPSPTQTRRSFDPSIYRGKSRASLKTFAGQTPNDSKLTSLALLESYVDIYTGHVQVDPSSKTSQEDALWSPRGSIRLPRSPPTIRSPLSRRYLVNQFSWNSALSGVFQPWDFRRSTSWRLLGLAPVNSQKGPGYRSMALRIENQATHARIDSPLG